MCIREARNKLGTAFFVLFRLAEVDTLVLQCSGAVISSRKNDIWSVALMNLLLGPT